MSFPGSDLGLAERTSATWAWEDLPPGRPRLVVGIDASSQAANAVDRCGRLAQRLAAFVVAVHGTMEESDGPATVDDLERWCVPLQRHDIDYVAVVVADYAVPLLCEIGDLVGADLIVVGASRRSELGEFVFGGVGSQLAHHGDRPVLIVPPCGRSPVRPALEAMWSG